MTLILTEGFDGPVTTSTMKGAPTVTGATLSTTAGRNGTKGVYHTSNSTFQSLDYTLSSTDAHATCVVGVAFFQRTTLTANSRLIKLANTSGGTTIVILYVRTDGKIQVDITEGSASYTSSNVVIAQGAWYYIEFKFVIDDAAGSFEVRVNGTNVLSQSSIDTKFSTITKTDNIIIYLSQPSGSVTSPWYLDDMYFLNGGGSSPWNTFLGPIRIETLLASGNGNSSQWVGSDANSTDNYALVNDTSDSTYVTGIVDGDKDTYACGNPAITTGTVLGAVVWSRTKVDILGRKIVGVARLSGTEVDATGQTLTTSFVWYGGLHETKPGGGSWSFTNLSDAEFGIKAST